MASGTCLGQKDGKSGPPAASARSAKAVEILHGELRADQKHEPLHHNFDIRQGRNFSLATVSLLALRASCRFPVFCVSDTSHSTSIAGQEEAKKTRREEKGTRELVAWTGVEWTGPWLEEVGWRRWEIGAEWAERRETGLDGILRLAGLDWE